MDKGFIGHAFSRSRQKRCACRCAGIVVPLFKFENRENMANTSNDTSLVPAAGQETITAGTQVIERPTANTSTEEAMRTL
jgi:hypothetical protein